MSDRPSKPPIASIQATSHADSPLPQSVPRKHARIASSLRCCCVRATLGFAQVRPLFQKMCREAVAEHVRRHTLGDPCACSRAPQGFSGGIWIEGPAPA